MNIIPSLDFGGDGLPLHFLHANGYPPASYQPLIDSLTKQYRVFGMLLRPLWENARMEDLQDWRPLSDDLLRLLSTRKDLPAIGVGHSVGAIVTLRAALRDPRKFRALILLDPVLFAPPILFAWNMVRAVGLGNKLHPKINGALKRRRAFDNLDLVFRGYRARSVFRYVSDDALRAYIAGMTRPAQNGGYELVYSPEWEAHIYLTGLRDFDLWKALPALTVPTLILRGAETDAFLPNAARLVQKKNPRIQVQTLERATHILPLEHPQEIAERIQKFLK
ncbi:MAG: alpha/beta hydrolase [Anaerolineales bacterium]